MRKLSNRVILVPASKSLRTSDARANVEVGKVYRSFDVSWVIVKSVNEDGTVTVMYEDDRTNTEYTLMPEYMS